MPAFGKRTPGGWRPGYEPQKTIRDMIVLQIGASAPAFASAPAPRNEPETSPVQLPARRAIIRWSGDATRAQRDAEDAMTADQGQVAPPMPATSATPAGTPEPLYGGQAARRLTIRDIAAAKARGEKWPMLTAYDALTAS